MFVVFACTQDCLNCGESDKKSNEDSNLEKRLTTLQDVVDNANAGEEIDLSDYELTSYTATVNKKLTIKNGSLKNATLIITSENVKLEKLTDLSVATSSRLTINDSKLSDLLIGNATSESRATAVDIAIAMVSVAGCEIENVELNGFNSQLNITDVKTKINDIMTSTKVKVILEAGSYEGMKDPVVENNGELTRIDMTKEKTLSVLSIYSHPTKAEYQIDEKLDTTGLIVMGTYTASVEIFKSGGWKGEAVESVTKWEDEKDYAVTYEDFSTAGVKIVTITSNIDDNVKSNFFVYVKDSQNSEIKEPEITDITIKPLETSKTLYIVGERLDLIGFQVVGTYNGVEINLPYRSEPVYGEQLTAENTQITFYYNGEIISTKEITVTEPCEVEFYDGIGESSLLYMLEMADGESLRLPVDPQRGNYTFAGWYNGDEKIESGYKVTSTLKLTARWNTKNYTVIFYANDTSDKIIKQTFVLDVEQALMKNSFIREGYTFVGWAKNGFGEKVYDDCAIVKNLTDKVNDEVTLYAKWAANTYTVKFNANGGSGEMADMSFNYNEEKALTVNIFTRKDYTFAGWATSADGDVIYADEQNVKNLTAENKATVTLYAVWKNNNACYVSYNDSPENQYFKIIQDAVDFVIEKNNGNQEFTIYVMSDVINEADVSNNAFININPANALKLKICSSDSEIKTINAGGKSRVMYIGNTNSDSTVKTTVILEDIILTGGKSSTGSGVYVEKGGSFTMTGGTYVANSNNVYLANGTTITVMGELTGATTFATITPSSYSEGTQVLKAGDGSINLLNYVSKFKLSDSNWSIDVDGKIYDKTTVTLGAIVYSDKTVSRFYHQTKTMIGYVIAIENGKATKIVSVDETYTDWDEAKTWCDNYVDKSRNIDWTLPTKKNLKLVFEAKDEINKSIERIIAGGGDASKLSDTHYWSSDISTVYEAYAQDFSIANFFANARSKNLYCLVRAVRDF